MTKQEFYEFVDSFNNNYDEIALLSIGKKFRELPVKQRNWGDLVKYLGLKKSADAFRTWVYRNEAALEDLVTSNSQDADVEVEEINEAEETSNKDASFREQYKVITQNRDVLNAYRRLIRNEARIDTLKETIQNTVDQLNDLPDLSSTLETSFNPHSKKNEAVLLLSDLHIGVEVDNVFNVYNKDVAAKRLDKFVNDAIEYCHLMGVYRLNVLNLGDMIHGLIHTTARIEQELDVIDQIMVASELIAKALNKLQYAAPEVIYRSVTDNHARTMANYKENIENENFYRLIDWYVEERLKNSSIVFDKKSNVDPSFCYFKLLNGQTAVAAHGHLDDINRSIQCFSGMVRQVVDNVFLAHYHDEKVKNFQGSTVFVNGSIVGPEQYAISKRLFNYPTQKLIIYLESTRMDISIKLN